MSTPRRKWIKQALAGVLQAHGRPALSVAGCRTLLDFGIKSTPGDLPAGARMYAELSSRTRTQTVRRALESMCAAGQVSKSKGTGPAQVPGVAVFSWISPPADDASLAGDVGELRAELAMQKMHYEEILRHIRHLAAPLCHHSPPVSECRSCKIFVLALNEGGSNA